MGWCEEHKEKTARETSAIRYELVCENCGTISFKPKSSISKTAKNTFCSKQCVGKYTAKPGSKVAGKEVMTEDTVAKIKELHLEGMTAYRIGKMLGISAVTAMKYISVFSTCIVKLEITQIF